MEKLWVCVRFLFSTLVLLGLFPGSLAQISSSETRILFQLRQHLEYPDALKSWNTWTNPCYLPYSPAVTVVCANGHVTEITVIGNKTSPSLSSKPLFVSGEFAVSEQTLSQKFSTDSLFTDLTKLTGLKKLSLVSLGIWGPLPPKISRFQSLEMLNISSNFIYGEIPPNLSSLKNLKSLVLADNWINGSLDLSGIKGLQEVDLSNNQIGPNFPSLGTSLVSLLLRNNSLRSQIPTQVRNLAQLQRLDVSSNHLAGPIPPFVFSLPSLWYLNLAENQLTGELPKSTSCGKRLWFVDISRNLLVGNLPSCIGSSSSKYRKVLSVWNCLEGDSKFQRPLSFCQRQALAVIPLPKKRGEKQENSGFRMGTIFGVIGGTVLLVATVGLLICIIRKRRTDAQSYKYNKSTAEKTLIRPSPIIDQSKKSLSVSKFQLSFFPLVVLLL